MYNIQKFQCELYKYSSKKTEVETSYILRDTILQERYLEIQNTQQFNNISQKIFIIFFSYRFLFYYLFSNSHVQRNTSRL